MERIVVLVTAPSEEEAERLAKALVEERLAACVNIIKGIKSVYRWEGNVAEDFEALMIIKTRADRFDALMNRVKELHPYTVPEIIALPIVKGSPDYLNWLDESAA